MRQIVFGTSLLAACVAAGCSNSLVHQSLLIQENRRLEDALYTAQAQVAGLKQENNSLRKQQANEYSEFPSRSQPGSWGDDFDDFPAIEMPKVVLPGESSTTEVPEWMKGSQLVPPAWGPKR